MLDSVRLVSPEREIGVIYAIETRWRWEETHRVLERAVVGVEFDGDEMLTELRKTRQAYEKHGTLLDDRVDELEKSINEILVRARRPGAESYGDDRDDRRDAIKMCLDRHSWQHQKNEGRWIEYAPSSAEIEEATMAQKAFRAILRHGDF